MHQSHQGKDSISSFYSWTCTVLIELEQTKNKTKIIMNTRQPEVMNRWQQKKSLHMSRAMRKHVICHLQTTEMQCSLHMCLDTYLLPR